MKKFTVVFISIILVLVLFSGCGKKNKTETPQKDNQSDISVTVQDDNSSLSVPEGEAITNEELCREFAGTWTDDTNEFIHFSIDDGVPSVLFATWGSGNYSNSAEITNSRRISDTTFTATLKFSNKTSDCTITNLNTGYIEVTLDGNAATAYFYDGRQQYPLMQ